MKAYTDCSLAHLYRLEDAEGRVETDDLDARGILWYINPMYTRQPTISANPLCNQPELEIISCGPYGRVDYYDGIYDLTSFRKLHPLVVVYLTHIASGHYVNFWRGDDDALAVAPLTRGCHMSDQDIAAELAAMPDWAADAYRALFV
jgi:hypothetical protein